MFTAFDVAATMNQTQRRTTTDRQEDRGVPDEGDVLGGRRESVDVGELQGQQREDDRDDRLSDELGLDPQTGRPPPEDLDVVVGEPD